MDGFILMGIKPWITTKTWDFIPQEMWVRWKMLKVDLSRISSFEHRDFSTFVYASHTAYIGFGTSMLGNYLKCLVIKTMNHWEPLVPIRKDHQEIWQEISLPIFREHRQDSLRVRTVPACVGWCHPWPMESMGLVYLPTFYPTVGRF